MAQQRTLHAHFFWPKACEKPLPIAVCLHASFNNVAKAAAVVVVACFCCCCCCRQSPIHISLNFI